MLEAVQVALELGNDINAVDNNGETAMHGAAYKNLPAVVQLSRRQRAPRSMSGTEEQARLDTAHHRGRASLR